jgi:hypothetical protein
VSAEHRRLAVSLVASIVINVLVIIPLLAADLGAAGVAPDPGAAVKVPDFQDQPDPTEVKLGIDESEASTLTWIGYEQYQEHMAQLSELDQAQFTVGGGATGGGGAPNPPAPEPSPPASNPTEPATPSQVPAPESATPPPVPTSPHLPDRPDPELPAPAETDGDAESTEPAQQETPTEPPTPQTPTPQTPTPAQPPPTPPSQPQPPGTNTPPGPPEPTPGVAAPGSEDLPPTPDSSDRESDASARVPVNIKKRGGPVAAAGLEVRTRRPQLTPFQEMQFGRLAIIARIEFDKEGKPRRIFLGRPHPRTGKMQWTPSKRATGFESVVINALFRWRASGKKLQTLEPDGTIPIVFELTYR